MSRLFLLFLLSLEIIPFVAAAQKISFGRKNIKSLWNFEFVTECVLHYRATVYNNYGCWCGIGGAYEPMDGIDACCRDHDHCYDAAVAKHQCYNVEEEYVDPYAWQCIDNTAICKEKDLNTCAAALCACDTAVVNCWHQFAKPEAKTVCNHTRAYVKTRFFHH